jgi:hypothetical protein
MRVRKERRMLMRLDDRALQDIGFDKVRVYGEANRSSLGRTGRPAALLLVIPECRQHIPGPAKQ